MRWIFIQFLRLLAFAAPKFALRFGNAVRIRNWSGGIFNLKVGTRYFGIKLQLQCREWLGFFIIIGRCYECMVLQFIRQHASQYRVFFDIGANFGIHSLVFAHSNHQSRVISFEPIPDIHSELIRNIDLNPRLSNITTLCVGISEQSGLFPFVLKKSAISRGEASLICNSNVPVHSQMWVPCFSIQDVAKKLELWPDFVKIDVEGAEVEVLKGLKNGIAAGHPHPDLLIEVHGWMFTPNENTHSFKVLNLLQEMGYTVWRLKEEYENTIIQEGRIPPLEITRIPEGNCLLGRDMILASTDPNKFEAAQRVKR